MSAGESPVFVRFGELELDEARFELRRRNEPVAIQPKVLDLVLYLVRHRARVVSKEEILSHVWSGVVVAEGSLSQAVSVARRILDDPPEAQRLVRTVRGRGFQFVGEVETLQRSSTGGTRVHDVTSVSLDLGDETADSTATAPARRVPHLTLLLHGDDITLGGARHCLADVDEVEIVRGKARGADRRTLEITRRLVIRLPGDAVSRIHARFVRAHDSWSVADAGSKNGTFVNGRRIEREMLENGDLVECGRTHFLFRDAVSTPPELPASIDSSDLTDAAGSLVPELALRQHVFARIARSDLAILIVGETGTGKEHLAQDIHARSGREGPFVPVQCHALGAAIDDALDEAREGTLFLDRVEDLSRDDQAALVAALSGRPSAAMRTIAASTSAVETFVAEGTFRRDLYTRLAGYRLDLLPLRDRIGDMGLLIARLLRGLDVAPPALDSRAAQQLFAYEWPGNVRELRQCLASAIMLADGKRVELAHLPEPLRRGSP
jgi:DNA-binding winged helix-turn-helix (wHTH) protein